MLFPQNVCISGSGDCLLSDLSCLSVTSEDVLQCKSSFRGNIYVKLLRCYYTLKDHSFSGQLSLSSSSPCLYVYNTVSERLVHLRTDLVGLFDKRQGSDETNVVNFDIRELLIIITKTKIPTGKGKFHSLKKIPGHLQSSLWKIGTVSLNGEISLVHLTRCK